MVFATWRTGILGSLTEAEDAVQEAYTRWYALTPDQRGEVESPAAWPTWWKVGAITAVVNIVIWMGVGSLWMKVLGHW